MNPVTLARLLRRLRRKRPQASLHPACVLGRGGPDRAWPVGGRVCDRAFRQHQLPSGNTAGGLKSNQVRFHLSRLDCRLCTQGKYGRAETPGSASAAPPTEHKKNMQRHRDDGHSIVAGASASTITALASESARCSLASKPELALRRFPSSTLGRPTAIEAPKTETKIWPVCGSFEPSCLQHS